MGFKIGLKIEKARKKNQIIWVSRLTSRNKGKIETIFRP